MIAEVTAAACCGDVALPLASASAAFAAKAEAEAVAVAMAAVVRTGCASRAQPGRKEIGERDACSRRVPSCPQVPVCEEKQLTGSNMSLSTDRQALLDQLRKEREERRAAEL